MVAGITEDGREAVRKAMVTYAQLWSDCTRSADPQPDGRHGRQLPADCLALKDPASLDRGGVAERLCRTRLESERRLTPSGGSTSATAVQRWFPEDGSRFQHKRRFSTPADAATWTPDHRSPRCLPGNPPCGIGCVSESSPHSINAARSVTR